MTRVAVIASSAVSQAGLESLLKLMPSIEVVDAGSQLPASRDWIQHLDSENADVLLLEGFAEQSILQNLSERIIEEQTPAIIVLTHSAIERRSLVQMLTLGVRGLLPISASAAEIAAAIQAAASGLTVFHSDFQRDLFDERWGMRSELDGEKIDSLTVREKEVLDLLSQGFSNRAIAAKLHLSEHTIKFHIGTIFEKLNASSRTEAVAIGLRQGLIML